MLNPIIAGVLFLVLAPIVAWIVNRFLARGARVGADFDTRQRLVGVLAAVVLLAGSFALVTARWGHPLGDCFRLEAIQDSTLGSEASPGVRLLSERSSVSSCIGLDEYTAGEKDRSQATVYERVYRVDGSRGLPDVVEGFEGLAAADGWNLAGASCVSERADPSIRFDAVRFYERRLSGFRATLMLSWVTHPSAVAPGTAMSDVHVRLQAPAVLTSEPLPLVTTIQQDCLAPPAAAPTPPPPPGECDSAQTKLSVVVPEAAGPLADRPLRARDRPADLRRMRVTAADDEIVASSPPSEPRDALERHHAVDGYQAYDRPSRSERREATYAYQFPSHDEARAFHEEAVNRACIQGIEAFDVPGVPDAVGLRLYVPAPGVACREHGELQWGLGFGYGCEAEDFAIDYVAFVRGEYHVTAVAGTAEQNGVDLVAQRTAVLAMADAASRRACRAAVSTGVLRTCA